MNTIETNHFSFYKEGEGCVDVYTLAPGIRISFNQIYTSSWTKGDSSLFSEQMLVLNFCLAGRCDVSLSENRYTIVKEKQLCVSTILPTKDFYYPGRLYEGMQLYIDRTVLSRAKNSDLLGEFDLDIEKIITQFCSKTGLYLHRMNDTMLEIVQKAWTEKENPKLGKLRYFTLRLLYELMTMPCESETNTYFTRSQIAIVKEAESQIMKDLSKRITAKEMADHFGISESSFKLYVKGILGDSYLSYFRKKRMEKAASLLTSTDLKVIEIANSVGYENQGKFAKVFAEMYGASPLEFRRLHFH